MPPFVLALFFAYLFAKPARMCYICNLLQMYGLLR